MKVTVTFGDTAVVVPCKAGWLVKDLIEQAARRYRRILEQVNTQRHTQLFTCLLVLFSLRHVHNYCVKTDCRRMPLILLKEP